MMHDTPKQARLKMAETVIAAGLGDILALDWRPTIQQTCGGIAVGTSANTTGDILMQKAEVMRRQADALWKLGQQFREAQERNNTTVMQGNELAEALLLLLR